MANAAAIQRTLRISGVTSFIIELRMQTSKCVHYILGSFLLAGSFAFAQTRRPRKPTAPAAPKTEQTSWPLETLKVEGNQNYTAAQILTVAGLRIGQTVGKPEFEAARERLDATGVFDRVGYRFAPARDSKGFDG